MLNALIKYVFSKNTNPKTHYSYYGRMKIKVILITIKNLLKKQFRQKFIDKNFIKNIPNEKFFLYTMHQAPERSLLITAPFYTNELEIIKNIVKSLPFGYKLCIKEHHSMDSRDWRKVSFYKEIMNLPNVIMLHPSLSPYELIKKSSLVISISGTSSLEAAFFEKPSIVFAETSFSHINSIYKIDQIEKLPNVIRLALKTKVNNEELNNYVNIINENSFIFNNNTIVVDFQQTFTHGGFLADIELSIPKMEKFLKKHENQFKELALEHLKIINQKN
jgi:hypothetical protein